MTYREKAVKETPERIQRFSLGGVLGCPDGMPKDEKPCMQCNKVNDSICRGCWDKEAPETVDPVDDLFKLIETIEQKEVYSHVKQI